MGKYELTLTLTLYCLKGGVKRKEECRERRKRGGARGGGGCTWRLGEFGNWFKSL